MIRSLAAAVLVIAASSAPAQTRPDFSGTWTLASGPQACGASLTLAQDNASLRVQLGGDSEHAHTYKFDGTDTRDALAPAPPRRADLTPGTWEAHRTRTVARAAWNGDRFVVITHTTMTMTWPEMVAGEFEREWTVRETFSFDPAGRLALSRDAIADPLPGGTARRLELPDSWVCGYTKTGE